MNITDMIDNLAAEVHAGKNLDEAVDSYINTASFETHTEILEEIGDRDLSQPGVIDLTAGWTTIRAQLAYCALAAAVGSAVAELRAGDSAHAPGCSGDCEPMPNGALACETPIAEVNS